ncbi:uncharacterized protein LOC126750051 [Anthonomus grandis grandis]|uniref:uncharacterized protein LOC126750051 n=1 Tax=Anthonomus grandis grandis TaxID=2921223 RepID=UPI0021667A32|nr:uncharacterized protein LOC126750051 [Anthonomus grandis grandis]
MASPLANFKPVYIYCSLLGLTPPYSFPKKGLIKPQLCFKSVIALAILFVIGQYQKLSHLLQPESRYIQMDTCLNVIAYFGMVKVMFGMINNKKQWKRFLQNLDMVEEMLRPLVKRDSISSWKTTQNLLVKLLLQYTIVGYNFYIWSQIDPVFYATYRQIITFYNTTFIIILYELANMLHQTIKDINTLLITCPATVRVCRRVCFEVQRNMKTCNRVFSDIWGFYFILNWCYALIILDATYSAMILAGTDSIKVSAKVQYAFSYFVSIVIMLTMFYIMSKYSNCSKTFESITTSCQDLLRVNVDITEEQMEELRDFIKQIEIKKLYFSISGVTNIDKKLIIIYASNLMRYFIIHVQWLNQINQESNVNFSVNVINAISVNHIDMNISKTLD